MQKYTCCMCLKPTTEAALTPFSRHLVCRNCWEAEEHGPYPEKSTQETLKDISTLELRAELDRRLKLH